MQRNTETFEAEFVSQSKFFEAEEVFINIFRKVTAHKLLAAIVEGTDAILSSAVTQSRTLVRVS